MTDTRLAAEFAALEAHKRRLAGTSVLALFESDPSRAKTLQGRLDDLLFDFSKQRIDADALGALLALARAGDVEGRRAKLFAGDVVNPTEGRPALHMALRDFSGTPILVDGRDVMPEVRAERDKMLQFAESIRSGGTVGSGGARFTDVVNIGIGGSDLGPAMAARALAPFGDKSIRTHFVSNVDGADIGDTLAGLDPARTLFIVSSKTFTTQETMTNAASARAFIARALGEAAVTAHFAAVSTKLDKVAAFGIAPDRVFGFKDWVGGRYSVWSSIGLALAILIGRDGFCEFLRGGAAVDRHFQEAPLERNIPVLMGLLQVWNRDVWGFSTQAVIPYDQRLGRFPAYLQQLEMESNGKSVQLDGAPLARQTCPIVWGEPGTNGQHAFFQMIHQGTEPIPVDFLVAAHPTQADAHHHDLLFANCLAQGEALMRGRTTAEAHAQLMAAGSTEAEAAALAPHKTFSGNRPTSTFLYRQMTPDTLGRLIALYEHQVFVSGVIWNIDSFDQWGVELGKELANRLVPIVAEGRDASRLDGSTAGLIVHRRDLLR